MVTDVELWKKTVSKEWQTDLGTSPTPNAELLSNSPEQLGFEAQFIAIAETNNAERDVEVDGGHQCTFRETLWATPMSPRQLPFELPKESEDAQWKNNILRRNDMAGLPSLVVPPMQRHEMLPQNEHLPS